MVADHEKRVKAMLMSSPTTREPVTSSLGYFSRRESVIDVQK